MTGIGWLRSRGSARPAAGSARRLFAVYAAASLIPVLVLGLTLLHVLSDQGNARGLSQGRADANLIARTSIAPLLEGHDVRFGLSTAELGTLRRTVGLAVHDGQVLRLRLRTLDGDVVFSDDSSTGAADGEALDAVKSSAPSRGSTPIRAIKGPADLEWWRSMNR